MHPDTLHVINNIEKLEASKNPTLLLLLLPLHQTPSRYRLSFQSPKAHRLPIRPSPRQKDLRIRRPPPQFPPLLRLLLHSHPQARPVQVLLPRRRPPPPLRVPKLHCFPDPIFLPYQNLRRSHQPQKALRVFYTMVEFDCRPSVKHLNCILHILVSHRNFLRPAFDVFKDAHRHGLTANTESYNLLMRAFCLNGYLSIAYQLFKKMFERDLVPDMQSYRILMQDLCRNGQVNTAVDFLEDMLNKGFVPDTLSYTTLLNSLCRKKKLREAYKLLCRMKVKGCNPDIVHYNTVILGFSREGRPGDACKVLEDMASNGCLPNLVSHRTLVSGLCAHGMLDEAKSYMEIMVSKGFSVIHALVKGFCNVGRFEEACGVLEEVLNHGEVPHMDIWITVVPGICEEIELVRMEEILREVMKVEIRPNTRIVEAAFGLEDYLIIKIQANPRRGY